MTFVGDNNPQRRAEVCKLQIRLRDQEKVIIMTATLMYRELSESLDRVNAQRSPKMSKERERKGEAERKWGVMGLAGQDTGSAELQPKVETGSGATPGHTL